MKRIVSNDSWRNVIHFFEDNRSIEQLEKSEWPYTLCGEVMYSGYGSDGWRTPNSDDLDRTECIKCHNLYYHNQKEGE